MKMDLNPFMLIFLSKKCILYISRVTYDKFNVTSHD